MKVRDLKIILDHVPDDLEVFVTGSGGLYHLGEVIRTKSNAVRPGSLHLEDGRAHNRVLWFHDAPPYILTGQFRRPVELELRLAGIMS